LLHYLTAAQARRFTSTIWSLWKHRNLKLWQNALETIAHVVDRSVHMLEDWKMANVVAIT